jgi:site-specific recombinase XerD
MTPNAVGKRLTKLLGPGWSGHTLRHRFLTRALENSGDLAATQQLAGHASPATTKGYARASASALRDVVNAIT